MLNLNVGILGHVDSGKTSLAKVLSKVASTAAFDKNPQSQERGITLDLGFSSFTLPVPKHLSTQLEDDILQFTLVDCPGHASLIRTIIGGAQIIDMMLLVIDATKGIQTQTAECLIIGELTCKKMIVVVNKIDLLPTDKQTQAIEKMTKKLKVTLGSTMFKESPLVYIAANPENNEPVGIEHLVKVISDFAFIPNRNCDAPFLFAVDHCFSIKGQGTIMTGTLLQGSIENNDMVQIPYLNLSKKVKSMQMFRKPIHKAKQGDRIGICVTQFDPKLFERGIICAPDLAVVAYAAIIRVEKIRYFKLPIKTKSKFHISIGYETVMATVSCFSINQNAVTLSDEFDFVPEYTYCDQFDDNVETDKEPVYNYLLLEFEKAVITVPKSLAIGSKLDMDVHGSTCRLAFWGKSLEIAKDKNYKTTFLPLIKIFKTKRKEGIVDRMVNENEIIVKNMFKKETNVQQFIGLTVSLITGEVGKIENQFGQSGKIKVYLQNGLDVRTVAILKASKKKGKNSSHEESFELIKVILEFKRYIYDVHKKIIQ